MPLTTINARATFRLADKVYVFGGFEWNQEAYLLAHRDNLCDQGFDVGMPFQRLTTPSFPPVTRRSPLGSTLRL